MPDDHDDALWSQLTVAQVRQQSRLVASRSVQPLKIINPAAPASPACHAVLASYGGGLVAGDSIRLRVRCEAGSRPAAHHAGQYAHFQINRRPAGRATHRRPRGRKRPGRGAARPAGAPGRQPLPPGAALAAGRQRHASAGRLVPRRRRTDLGEQFAFTTFATELRVSVAGRLALLDRFALRPQEHLATSQATFGPHQSALSIYLVGPPAGAQFQQLAAALRQLPPPRPNGAARQPGRPPCRGGRNPGPRQCAAGARPGYVAPRPGAGVSGSGSGAISY